jgi:HAMP domain-containing protein
VLARALPGARLTRNALASALLGAAAVGLLLWSAAERRTAPIARDTSAAAAGEPQTPPPLPPAGLLDSLQGLVTVPPESLPRFEVEEHAYEEEAVKVYGHRGNWYLVGLREGGRAWLDTRATGRFLPLEELLTNRLNYLTAAWDARVRPEPDLSSPTTEVRVARAVEPEVPADVLESRRIGGTLWLRVEVHAESPCERGEKPPVIATGWIPAWAPDGRPTAWYYARGC